MILFCLLVIQILWACLAWPIYLIYILRRIVSSKTYGTAQPYLGPFKHTTRNISLVFAAVCLFSRLKIKSTLKLASSAEKVLLSLLALIFKIAFGWTFFSFFFSSPEIRGAKRKMTTKKQKQGTRRRAGGLGFGGRIRWVRKCSQSRCPIVFTCNSCN